MIYQFPVSSCRARQLKTNCFEISSYRLASERPQSIDVQRRDAVELGIEVSTADRDSDRRSEPRAPMALSSDRRPRLFDDPIERALALAARPFDQKFPLAQSGQAGED
jgi:hypothetical protein